MKVKRYLAKIREHWGYCALILCTLVGGILLKPMFGLVPILLNMRSLQSAGADPVLEPNQVEYPTDALIDQSYDYFLPLLTSNEPHSESVQQNNKIEPFLSSIDFSPNGSPIRVNIKPKHDGIESDDIVTISFLPGNQCSYGDGRACVYTFNMPNQRKVTLISIHSGMGGEGEPFRDLVEGTGINQGFYAVDQAIKNAQAIIGSDVLIKQGEFAITGLALSAIARIPPAHVETYLSLPIELSLAYAVDIGVLDPDNLDEDMFVFETCGWQLPGEEKNADYPNSTQSIYLGIVH